MTGDEDANNGTEDVNDVEASMLSLPNEIEPGEFAITFGSDVAGGDLVQYEVSFSWGGGIHATPEQDIGFSANLSPASSAPRAQGCGNQGGPAKAEAGSDAK